MAPLSDKLHSEWHDKNPGLPTDFSANSNKKSWWLCSKGHEWQAKIQSRTLGSGCPFCTGKKASAERNLAAQHPELLAEWHPQNPLSPQEFLPNSAKFARWRCRHGHEWQARIYSRAHGHGCPYCSHRLVDAKTSAFARRPELLSEWRGDGNPHEVSCTSAKIFTWQCPAGHRYRLSMRKRMYRGCPLCARKTPDVGNSLAAHEPLLAQEWHPDKNDRSPAEVAPLSAFKAWWLCCRGHSWRTSVANRVGSRSACPYCLGKFASPEYNLAALRPEVAAQWHPDKNSGQPTDVTPSSSRRIWWLCSKGHEWQATVGDRTALKSRCPSCSGIHTQPERDLEALLGFPKYNRSPLKLSARRLRPDVRVNDRLFVNVDGLYWHCELNRSRRAHRELRLAFEAEGLRILQFYADELESRPQVIKSVVAAIAGAIKTKVFARRTSVVIPTLDKADVFLDENHLMGRPSTSRFLALECEGFVSVMAYQVKSKHLEITRFASVLDTVVVGGFQKLLAALRRRHPGLPVRTLVDLRYADGHSLELAGFRPVREYLQYQYTDGKTRRDKRHFRVDAGVDERQAAADQGWYRIYDAGRRVYELTD